MIALVRSLAGYCNFYTDFSAKQEDPHLVKIIAVITSLSNSLKARYTKLTAQTCPAIPKPPKANTLNQMLMWLKTTSYTNLETIPVSKEFKNFILSEIKKKIAIILDGKELEEFETYLLQLKNNPLATELNIFKRGKYSDTTTSMKELKKALSTKKELLHLLTVMEPLIEHCSARIQLSSKRFSTNLQDFDLFYHYQLLLNIVAFNDEPPLSSCKYYQAFDKQNIPQLYPSLNQSNLNSLDFQSFILLQKHLTMLNTDQLNNGKVIITKKEATGKIKSLTAYIDSEIRKSTPKKTVYLDCRLLFT